MINDATSGTVTRYHELLELMGGDQSLLEELIDVFLEDAPKRIAEVRGALAAGDPNAIYRAAHALKGSAGNFGAPEVVAHSLQIETCAKGGDMTGAQNEFASLEVELERLVSELTLVRQA
jgi:two-component system, sensor histidine kinase and response regulator